MGIRDELRSAAFKSVPRKRFSFTHNGKEFELLEPTNADTTLLKQKLGVDSDEVSGLIWMVILLTVIPSTNERVFEDTDFDSFKNQTFEGFLSSATKAVNMASDVKKTQESSEMTTNS